MVGPLSSEEIEDVVSSVRRLVSNEQGPRKSTRDLTAERMMLTPALRVVSEIGPLSTLILEMPVPEAELAADPVSEVSPLAEEVGPEANEPAAVDPVAVTPATDEPAVEIIEADWEDVIWAAPEAVSLGEAALGAEEAEVLLPPVEDAPVEILTGTEAEAAGPAPTEADAETWAQVDGEWVEDEPVPFIPLRRRAEHLAARVAAGALDPDETEDTDHDDAPATPQRDVAAELLEDDPMAADLDGDAPVARGIEGGGDDHVATAQRMPTEILDADGTPLAVLDEAALQEIVRQMIREELQGALGERITRNVRKLVRAEINRALVARDLD